MDEFYFPFGEKLTKVYQDSLTPKKVFVLGVYASAVHAKWTDKNGKQKVAALAVASEPSIFWTGENAEEIISKIKIPEQLGSLSVPKDKRLNGSSGCALDKLYLQPLGLSRQNSWLCDLLPESRVNEQQRKAIDTHYTETIIKEYNLPRATVPNFDKKKLDSPTRRDEILNELQTSKADTLILLGDLPINWFLRYYSDKRFTKLSEFGEDNKTYGRPQQLNIGGNDYNVIALCHPRQADRLGTSSSKWRQLHDYWIKNVSQ